MQELTDQFPNVKFHCFLGRETTELVQTINDICAPSSGDTAAFATTKYYSIFSDNTLPPNIVTPVDIPFSNKMLRAAMDSGLVINIEGLSRGCEHKCLYCHLNDSQKTSGVIQDVSANSVNAIMNLYNQFGASCLYYFSDENFFGGGPSRLDRIIDFASKLKEFGFRGRIGVDSRIDTILSDKDAVDTKIKRNSAWAAMVDLGLSYCYFGIESLASSQLKRYGKLKQEASIMAGIRAAREFDLDFTIGLIMMDPLVTRAEILETIEKLNQGKMLHNAASLLKPMRLQPHGRYSKVLNSLFPNTDRDLNFLHKRATQQMDIKNEEVNRAWPLLSRIHSLFNESGYRHSDVMAHLSLLRDSTLPDIYLIANNVSRLEVEVIQMLLGAQSESSIVMQTKIRKLVRECSTNCAEWLHQSANTAELPLASKKVINHYLQTFNRVLDSLSLYI